MSSVARHPESAQDFEADDIWLSRRSCGSAVPCLTMCGEKLAGCDLRRQHSICDVPSAVAIVCLATAGGAEGMVVAAVARLVLACSTFAESYSMPSSLAWRLVVLVEEMAVAA